MRHYFMLEQELREAVQVGTAASAGVAYLFGAEFAEMIAWIVALMVTDHIVAILGVLISDVEVFELRKFLAGIGKKVAMILMFVPAAGVDRALVFADLLEPGRHPTVALVVIGLLVHESGSIVRNGVTAIGRLRFLVELLRRIDAIRFDPDEER